MGFSRQEYWSGLPFPSPGDLPDPGTEPGSPALKADAFPSEPPGKQGSLANAISTFGTIVHSKELDTRMYTVWMLSYAGPSVQGKNISPHFSGILSRPV